MADVTRDLTTEEKPQMNGVKPLQTIPYSQKTVEWRKQNMEYFLGNSIYKVNQRVVEGKGKISDMQLWYDAYNNKINESDYNYVTNPLNTKNELFKHYPARLRSYNILRPTIDLLIGEWSKRPFKFDVVNVAGEEVLNSFTKAKYATYSKNVTQRLVNEIQASQGGEQQKIPNPQTLTEDLNTNYKDLKAIKGYKALKVLEQELKLKETFKDCFKDWLLAGEVQSLKYVKRSDIEYKRLSPLWGDGDKSPLEKNHEDGSYRTYYFRVTVADLVDMFYEDLKPEDIKDLERDESHHRNNLFATFTKTNSKEEDKINKVDLYYCTWKSRKKFGILSYNDPFTGERLTKEVDEDYPVDKLAGETIEWQWVNEAWEGWRINDNKYIGMQPVAVQRNEMNNFSSCKLPINGRRFSDTESENISPMSLGMSYQIMYIIMNYRIELTIAKSKGKILIYDKNTISDDEEEQDKVFYYADALGYLAIDRSGDDVDRTWTSYKVEDMSLFEHIQQLISIAQFYKDQWEELMGISRQRKGAINSSDGLGASQEAIFRSSVISDIIFSGFDEWVETELQGLLDLSKFAWINGKKAYYRNDDGRMELLDIDPEDYANSELGIFVDSSGRHGEKLKALQEQINAIAQRKDVKLSTIADMIFTDSYAELKAMLKQAEMVEIEIANQMAENDHEREVEQEQIKQAYQTYQHDLDVDLMNKEWDRKDNNELIKGEIAGRVAKDPSGMDIDMTAIVSESNKRLVEFEKASQGRKKLSLEERKLEQADRHAKMKDATERKKISASLKNKVVGEK